MVHVRGTRRHDRRREFTEYCGGDPQPAVARLGSHDVEPGVADQQHSGGESGQEEQLPTLSAKNRGGRHQRHQQGVESEPGRRPVLRHIGVRQRHREEDDLGDQPDRTADHQSQPQRADALKRASRREEFDHRTFEPFEQLSSLRWWHPRDLLVAEFEPGRPLNLHTRTLVSLDGPDRRSRRCPIQRRQSIRFTCPSPGDRAESVLGVRPAV